jgi:hypothetical protein
MEKRARKIRGLSIKGVLCGLFLLFLVSAPQVYATEGGLGVYPDGIDDFVMGALPPPGVYFLNYLAFVNISNYKDIRGPGGVKLSDVPGAGTPGGVNSTPNVKGWTMFDAMRLVYVTKVKVLGGDFGMHAILPIQHLSFTKAEWGAADLLAGDHTAQKTGLKNLILAPVVGWHFSKNFHVLAACDIGLPTGAYARDDTANTGTGYLSFMPLVAVSYITDSGFEVGAKLMYDINTINKETGYYSGQAFHADYVVGQKFGPWNFGVNGYYFQQLENDTMRNEAATFDGNKGKAFSAGPAISYAYKNMFFKVKAQFDLTVDNRPETQRYWFNWIYAF